MPRGSRDGVPTLRRILNACATADRVVVVADEVDKCSGETSSSWSRGVLGELYSLLDRELPVQEYLQAAENRSLSVEQLKERVAAIWIIGIGTWQTLWQHRKSMGFVAHRADVLPSIVEPIRKSGVIPDELLLRFAWPPVAVPYPTARETADLFERSGLNALAARAGVVLRPHEHDWHEGGMRSLETLVTELTLKIRAQLNAPES